MEGMRILKSTEGYGDVDIIIDKDEFIIGRLAGHVITSLITMQGKLRGADLQNGACYVKDLNSMNGRI